MDTLLDDVRQGKVDISTLSGIKYQQLVFEQLLNKLFMDTKVLTVENNILGPVDYVVIEPGNTGMLAKNRRHYFECKNYSRALELDNIAKIMVVAVADQPDSVHVVSRTRLQPQIATYASRLFDIGTCGTPIFRSIMFRHWQTDQLLNFNQTSIYGGSETNAEESVRAANISWWLTECLAFSESEIASSDFPNRQITVRNGRLLLLTLDLPAEMVGHIEVVGLPDKSWAPVDSNNNGGLTPRRFSYLIDTMHLKAGETYLASVKVVSSARDIRIPLGEFRVGVSETLLPELRHEEVELLFHQIGPSGESRLVLVDGEAGVGKTYFIEKVAEELRAKFGFDVMCFTITEDNQESLMASLLRGCLTPPINQQSFQEVAIAVQKALLSDEFEERTLEVNVNLLARIATRMGPRVIVLRDCQYLTEQVANQLWTLIIAFNDASWGGLRLILEYRQPDATSNIALKSLIGKINLKVRRVLLAKSLLPLDDIQFSSVAVKIFQSVTPDISQCLMQRTGGLPLFIDSYLRRLIDIGFVTRNRDNPSQLSIDQPAQVLADTLPVNGQLILEQRIRTWLRDKLDNDTDNLTVELGLLAVAENAPSQSSMREALQMPLERLRNIQIALDDGSLGYGRPDGQVVFRHDLFRAAMISVAKSTATFAIRARETAERLIQLRTTGNEVQLRSLRAKIFSLIGDRVALEVELRLGIKAAQDASDYGPLVSFLSQLIALLPSSSNVEERFDFMNGLAWAAWVSDSLLIARERYLQLADQAEKSATGEFSFAEAIATDAYRRAIGIDLELMEPLPFLRNAITVLKRRQTPVTFNSIMNRLVLFCARFGYPELGYKFSELAFNYIGDGNRENEGAVLCSETGALYALAAPEVALSLFQQGVELASDECQHSYNALDITILETLHKGLELDLESFGLLWRTASQKRFSEVLTRASLLRGSLYLRAGDLGNARHWINRTMTMVNLYHLKEFQLPTLNDFLLLSILENDTDSARAHLVNLADEFEVIFNQHDTMSPLVLEAYEECLKAAEKLSVEPSSLQRPSQAPEHCNMLGEIWGNIALLATKLDVHELANKYSVRPAWIQNEIAVNTHRHVKCGDLNMVLGAY